VTSFPPPSFNGEFSNSEPEMNDASLVIYLKYLYAFLARIYINV